MGAITSDFPNLSQDSAPAAEKLFVFGHVKSYLQAQGESPTWDPSTVLRAEVLTDLQVFVGKLVQANITKAADTHPTELDFPAANDADAAVLFNTAILHYPEQIAGAQERGYLATALSTDLTLFATDRLAADPDFVNVIGTNTQVYIRFRNSTPAGLSLSGFSYKVSLVVASDNLNPQSPFNISVAADEVFDLINPGRDRFVARITQVLDGVPFCPTALTASDIAGARS